MKTKTMALVVVMVWCVMTAGICQAAPSSNGTITVGNLVWLKHANCYGLLTSLSLSKTSANNLQSGTCGLTDGSTAGQWRLPTKEELQGIYTSKSKFDNVQNSWYMSSTTNSGGVSYSINMGNGTVRSADLIVPSDGYRIYAHGYVWPVRSGP